ncbi:MAG: LysR family transcriptional regulator [Rudaea sp.]|uniref:LysR family transcriptional regulator n=1 Tax=Rudaea sp. TaxID=2136325 RepID=UPI0039E54DC1
MKAELELRHLRVFVTVVETGAHSRAARALGISQSTVSETLSALERALGTPVFRKTSKGSTLTAAGETLLGYARRTLATTNEMVDELARLSGDIRATLVVAAVESISTYVLPACLATLRRRWRKTRIEVITATCSEIRESVAQGKSDLGVLVEADTGSADDCVLARARLTICASPSHPLLRHGATPDQLGRCDFYMSDAAGNFHDLLRHYFDAAGLALPRIQALGTIEAVKRGIGAVGGTAVGLLPAYTVTREFAERSLAEIVAHPPLPLLACRAVLARGRRSPIVNELIADSEEDAAARRKRDEVNGPAVFRRIERTNRRRRHPRLNSMNSQAQFRREERTRRKKSAQVFFAFFASFAAKNSSS